MTDQKSQEGSGGTEKEKENRPKFMTRLGIEEVKFVRTAKKGNYTPTIHEIDHLIIEGKITPNELKVLTFIKLKTISFRNTETRLKRKDIQEKLQMNKRMLREAIHGLIEKRYLLEVADKDDYYFYGLNPDTFDGLIVLRSEAESLYRLNRNLKPIEFLNSQRSKKDPSKGSEKYPQWVLKVSSWGPFKTPETQSIIRNYSAFEMLKYTLLKYIYLNGFSEARGQTILEIVSEIKNPEYLIKQLVALIQSSPTSGKGVTEELIRAHTHKTDAHNRPIKTNALMYLVTCWGDVKRCYDSCIHFNLDQSEEMAAMRKELADLIGEYPIEQNQPGKVVEFKKAGA